VCVWYVCVSERVGERRRVCVRERERERDDFEVAIIFYNVDATLPRSWNEFVTIEVII
jgi:hypothetical protein